ncbi:MAG: hypothetical protein Q9168_003748 [Polycauliona sp. 1 TL-2023]
MSKSQCKPKPERKTSIALGEKTKPHIRACESCRTRKIRCLPQESAADGKCQRCAKSGRECIYSSPEKRKRRKRTDARVADLEHMVQMLAARLEQEQRARLDQQPRQDKFANNPNILSPPPSPHNFFLNTKTPLDQAAGRPQPQVPILNPKTNTTRAANPIPLPTTATLSPNLIVQEPLPSPLSQSRTPNIPAHRLAAWPSFHHSQSLDPQQPSTQDVYSPCLSTISHAETSSSEISQSTILDIPAAADNNTIFELPTASSGSSDDFNAMDAAISAQLNMPCQDQGIWWPQSNIMDEDFSSTDAAAVGAMGMGNWMPGEEEAFSWQGMMRWA